MERQITQSEVASAAANAVRNDLYVCYPGAVSAYNAGQETADIQVMTNDVRFDVDTGARSSEAGQLLQGVPVAWLRFGGFVIKGTLQRYDPVMLLAIDLDPTPWRAAGRTLKPVDPGDTTRLGGGYWFVLPTNLLLGHPQGAVTGSLTIGVEGAAPLITIDGQHISLGSPAPDAVALASKVDGITALLKTTANALGALTFSSTSGVTPVQQTALTAACQALAQGITTVASQLLKAQ